MKFFIGQAVRGEDKVKLKQESLEVVKILNEKHKAYCTFLESDNFGKLASGDKLKNAFEVINNCDTFLAIVRNDNKSEGLLIEIGYALCKGLKVIVLLNKNVGRTSLREVADQIIEFENFEDLCSKIKNLKEDKS